MAVGGQLLALGQTLQHVGFEVGVVALDVVEDRGLEDHEAAVDPALADLRLLGELGDEVAVEDEAAEARGRADGRHGGDAPLRAVEGEQLAEVDVAHAVAVGEEEGAVLQPRLKPLDAAARVRLLPRVLQVDAPVLALALLRLDAAAPEVNAHAPAQRAVVHEVALDDLAAVAERDEELLEVEVRVVAHDVPEDRATPDLAHRLRLNLGLLGEPRAPR